MKIIDVVAPDTRATWVADWSCLAGRCVRVFGPSGYTLFRGGYAETTAWDIPVGVLSCSDGASVMVRRVRDVEPADRSAYVVAGAAGVHGMSRRWHIMGRCFVYPSLRGVHPEPHLGGAAVSVGRANWRRLTHGDGNSFSFGWGIPGVLVCDGVFTVCRGGVADSAGVPNARVALLLGRCAVLPVVLARSI